MGRSRRAARQPARYPAKRAVDAARAGWLGRAHVLRRRCWTCDSSCMTSRVAVIGAGPGGLIAARWLLSQGFEPTIFEQSPILGGQWAGLVGRSGVWPAMHTNTSRVLTPFSDLEHETDAVFPSSTEILAYLNRFADAFDLRSRIRFDTRVGLISRKGSGWRVDHSGVSEDFDRVVVATGRFHAPAVPPRP